MREADTLHTTPQSADAVLWARSFMETKEWWGDEFELDEDLMVSWFANSMESMRDQVERQERERYLVYKADMQSALLIGIGIGVLLGGLIT